MAEIEIEHRLLHRRTSACGGGSDRPLQQQRLEGLVYGFVSLRNRSGHHNFQHLADGSDMSSDPGQGRNHDLGRG